MVTADRPVLAQRAILAYRQQTYPSTELVVLDNGAVPIRHLLGGLPPDEVRYEHVEKTPDLHIGALRNRSLELATGAFVAPQWDDDDWSHPERLERQLRPLLDGGFDASLLAGTLMHVDDERYFDHPFVGTLRGGVPPTIVHRRDAAVRYPNLRRTSDTHYAEAWHGGHRTVVLPASESWLYVRYQHGGNLWEADHFLRRARNTPRDLLLWGWHRHVRQRPFAHPRFRLSPEARAAFEQYLSNSFRFDLFRSRSRAEHEAAEPPSAEPPSA